MSPPTRPIPTPRPRRSAWLDRVGPARYTACRPEDAHGGPRSAQRALSPDIRRQSRLYRAPGRVNLIGEHTDYNGGFVLPAALEQCTWIAAAPRPGRRLRMHSLRAGETLAFDLDDPAPKPRHDWSDYVRGVAVMLQRDGNRLSGADLVIDSDVPVGSGLSSSAALEVATGFALLELRRPRYRPHAARALRPARRERIRRHALRRHGPVRLLLWRRRPRAAARLPQPRVSPDADRPFGAAGDLQLDGPPRTRRQRVQPPPRAMRRGRGGSVDQDPRRARTPRRHARRPRPLWRGALRARAAPLPPCRHRERSRPARGRRAGGRRGGGMRTPDEPVAPQHARRFEISCREIDILVDLAAGSTACWARA